LYARGVMMKTVILLVLLLTSAVWVSAEINSMQAIREEYPNTIQFRIFGLDSNLAGSNTDFKATSSNLRGRRSPFIL
ncbi:MAG: hypothetical protein U1C33_06370, partial [Candidatus Cloacimonadaceae bacterium]|nr:hypothetical protein [Candidatus Cloacimonadaceae bacterium]